MEVGNNFRWNKKYFKPIKDTKINENRNFCMTLSLVNELDENGNVIDKPILSVKKWRRRRDKKKHLYYQPSRGFNIRNNAQLHSIIKALESYGKELKWDKKQEKKTPYVLDEKIANLLNKDPELMVKLLEEIYNFVGKCNFKKIDITQTLNLVGSIDAELLPFFSKLTTETPEAIKELNKMLDNLSLTQINAFAKFIHVRLKALEVFQKLITSKKTYEFKEKKESMHHFLEENSWILGEDYELLSSNKTLKTIIKKKIGKKIKVRNERDRPDFALVGQDDIKLVIVEIKRPSYSLKLKDVNQLMKYKTIAEEYMGKQFQKFEGFLVGGKLNADVKANQ